MPDGRIDVTLTAPSGGVWSWEVGTSNGGEISTVAGPALDFCLVVTQRGNLADTDLSISGDQAGEWMSIAQAFAGPPGPGPTCPHPGPITQRSAPIRSATSATRASTSSAVVSNEHIQRTTPVASSQT